MHEISVNCYLFSFSGDSESVVEITEVGKSSHNLDTQNSGQHVELDQLTPPLSPVTAQPSYDSAVVVPSSMTSTSPSAVEESPSTATPKKQKRGRPVGWRKVKKDVPTFVNLFRCKYAVE